MVTLGVDGTPTIPLREKRDTKTRKLLCPFRNRNTRAVLVYASMGLDTKTNMDMDMDMDMDMVLVLN